MRSLSLYITASLLACSVSAANIGDSKKFPDYSLVLVGGGLHSCSSTNTRGCATPDVFSAAAKSADMFSVSTAQLNNIASDAFWNSERAIEQQQTLAVLEFVRSRLNNEQVSERELIRLWRSAEIEIDGIWVSGRENYSQLSDRERNFVLDQLQVMATAQDNTNRRRSAQRQKEFANLAQTSDAFSVEVYRKIVELAQQVAGPTRKPRLLVVTASGRDPFAAVDFYTNLFEEAGADVSWLPVNAAYQAAQQNRVDNKPITP